MLNNPIWVMDEGRYLHVIIYADIWTKYKDKQTITDCSVFRCLVLRVHRAAQHCHCSKTGSLISLKLWMSNYLHCQMPRHLNWNVVSGDANQARQGSYSTSTKHFPYTQIHIVAHNRVFIIRTLFWLWDCPILGIMGG